MDFGYKIITPTKGIRLQISLVSDFPGYVLTLWYSPFHLWGKTIEQMTYTNVPL